MHSRTPEPVQHRDLKPANLLLDANERIWVIDFGLSKMVPVASDAAPLAVSSAGGTPGYTPPEQRRGATEPRSDVYALAVTLHQLLTGHAPWKPEPLPPARELNPDISPAVEALIQQGTARQVSERPTAAAFLEALNTILEPPAEPVAIDAPDGSPVLDEAELVTWCEQHWEAAGAWLYDSLPQQIEQSWGKTHLADDLRQIVATQDNDHHVGLDQVLTLLDPQGYAAAPLQLSTDEAELDFGKLTSRQNSERPLVLTNKGRRYIRARLQTPPWIAADQPVISIPSGQQMTTILQANSSTMPAWKKAYDHIAISSGSTLLLEVSAHANTARFWQYSRGLAAIVIILVLVIVIGISFQALNNQMKPFAEWQEYTSEEGAFSVMLPGNPTRRTLRIDDIESVLLHVGDYGVEFTDFSGIESVSQSDIQRIFDGSIAQFLAERDGTLIDERAISLFGYPGREIEGQILDTAYFRVRMYLVQNRIYWVFAMTSSEETLEDTATPFLDSFTLTSPLVVALEDGIDGMTRQGGMDEAVDAFEQALAIAPDNPIALRNLALLYNLRHTPDQAEAAAREALELDPQDAFAWAMLGDALIVKRQFHDAREAAEKAIIFDEQLWVGYNIRALANAHDALETSNRQLMEEAIEDAGKGVELAAEAEQHLHQALAKNYHGEVSLSALRLTHDASYYTNGLLSIYEAIELQPEIARLFATRGFFHNWKREYVTAQDAFATALTIDADYIPAYTGLGWAAFDQQDYEQARVEFDRAIGLEPPDSTPYIGLSLVYQDMPPPDYASARAVLDDAAERFPEDPEIHSELGWIWRQQAWDATRGSTERRDAFLEAELAFRRALQVNDRYFDALRGLGWTLYDRGNHLQKETRFSQAEHYFQQAETYFRQALTVREENADTHGGLAWSLHSQKRDSQEAETHFRRAIAVNADYEAAHRGLGQVLYYQGRYDEAFEAFEAALDLQENTYTYYWLGRSSYQLEDYAIAEASFQYTTTLAPLFADGWIWLGDTYRAQGKRIAARQAYETALRLTPDHEPLQQALEELEELEGE
jgi:tetratricopeptide (TPR) repeat protein/serine/threonine protein kinase